MKPFFICLVGSLALMLAACGGLPAQSADAFLPEPAAAVVAATAAPAVQAAPFPVGHFRSISTPNSLVIAIHDHDHFQVFLDNALLDSGSLTVTGDNVWIDSLKCAARGSKPGLYTWIYAESDLTFQPVSPDPCSQRREYLIGDFEPVYLFINLFGPSEISGGKS